MSVVFFGKVLPIFTIGGATDQTTRNPYSPADPQGIGGGRPTYGALPGSQARRSVLVHIEPRPDERDQIRADDAATRRDRRAEARLPSTY